MIRIIFLLTFCLSVVADSISNNPIVFVTAVPNPRDFGTMAATFSNHVANPDTAFRGGDLWIRYPNGTLRNLTEAAGYGNSGFQGANSIAVRDPSVHWDGDKIIFSMVIGAPTAQYQLGTFRWQLYEITNFGSGQTPIITKVSNQPTAYNNHSPIYASDDSIIFVSDRPRDDTVLHTYPQRDEYESAVINTGLWKLSGTKLEILDHSPSGDFNPIIDSFGRVIFTRWDHLQRDQQNIGVNHGAFNYLSEVSNQQTNSNEEVFPEARSNLDPDKEAHVNLHTINQFFPWMMNQDGTDLETLNHIGRQEIGIYSERSFNDDPNVQEFYGQYSTGSNSNDFTIFLHIKEDPNSAGTYLGTNCQEFATHSSGQLISITGAPNVNPNNMVVTYLTHPDTSGASNSPSGNHSGLYRDPLPLSNGNLLASHTSETREDSNEGSTTNPISRYDLRLKLLTKPGAYYVPNSNITSGITKNVSFWNPDQLVSYNGELWEMMAVEVKSRTRPQAPTLHLPSVEEAVFQEMGVEYQELVDYLKAQNLALVVSRNVTVRDKNDRQQPTNLKVADSTTESVPNSGKVYEVGLMEFYQGDLIRSYTGGNTTGRRVLAQDMHSVPSGINIDSGREGAVKIASDGSMAAFVPARRALSWQLSSKEGVPVVRERYWVTFQPGEVRVCSSCHGVNTVDHLGNPPPENPPLALAQLLAHWKGLPPPEEDGYSLKLEGKKKPGGKFKLTVSGSGELKIRAKVLGKKCPKLKTVSSGVYNGRFPKVDRGKVVLILLANNEVKAKVSARLSRLKPGMTPSPNPCKALGKLKLQQ